MVVIYSSFRLQSESSLSNTHIIMYIIDFIESACTLNTTTCDLNRLDNLANFEVYQAMADLTNVSRTKRDIMDGIVKAYKTAFKAM